MPLLLQPFFPVVGCFPSEAITTCYITPSTPRPLAVAHGGERSSTIRTAPTIRTRGAAPRHATLALFGVVPVGVNLHFETPAPRTQGRIGEPFMICEYA